MLLMMIVVLEATMIAVFMMAVTVLIRCIPAACRSFISRHSTLPLPGHTCMRLFRCRRLAEGGGGVIEFIISEAIVCSEFYEYKV